jgi:hypothetical protein
MAFDSTAQFVAPVLLGVVPAIAYIVSRRVYPRRKWALTGICLGAIICPWSEALYSLFFVHPVWVIPGLFGLMSSMFHCSLPYQVAIAMGAIPERIVVPEEASVMLNSLGALLWAPIYGVLGAVADNRRERAAANAI